MMSFVEFVEVVLWYTKLIHGSYHANMSLNQSVLICWFLTLAACWDYAMEQCQAVI